MINLLKLLFTLFIFLVFTGCESNNNDEKNNAPSYRLVTENHNYHDELSDYNVTYNYDQSNRITSTEFNSLSTTYRTIHEYDFDTQNRLIKTSIFSIDSNNTKSLHFLGERTYSGDQNTMISSKNDINGDGYFDMIETHYFDNSGKISNITFDWDWGTALYFNYDDAREAYQYQFEWSFAYLTEPAAISVDGNIDINASYEYNNAGLVTKRIVDYYNGQDDTNTTYRYDDTGNLIELNSSSYNVFYTYDGNGSLRSKTVNSANSIESYYYSYTSTGDPLSTTCTTATDTYTTTYSYDDEGHLVTFESDFETLSYFAFNNELEQKINRGYMMTYGFYELSYDENDNLIQVVYYDNQNLIPTKTSTYSWEKAE